MSPEGINGILSGREGGLWGYKRELWAGLARLVIMGWDCDDDHKCDPMVGWLNMRYCWLHNDGSVEGQLFDVASMRITQEVVSLDGDHLCCHHHLSGLVGWGVADGGGGGGGRCSDSVRR